MRYKSQYTNFLTCIYKNLTKFLPRTIKIQLISVQKLDVIIKNVDLLSLYV